MNKETLPGIILMLTGALAMVLANSPFAEQYFTLINASEPVSLLFIVNDLLMTVFFLEIGLEIKEQVITGHLSKPQQVILPILAACGGVLLPAVIFLALNYDNAVAAAGWAIPTATDIAFALGVIMLLGKRIPLTLRVILLTIAVVDDLIAILIIAFVYSKNIVPQYLLLTSFCVMALIYVNIKHEKHLWLFILIGAVLCFCLYNAGVHPTISGVITGLAIPISIIPSIRKNLKPWVAFFILPVFAFANAGVSLSGMTVQHFLDPVPLGIALGLIVGKQLGVYSFAQLGVALKIAAFPKDITRQQFYGMGILCGIGFTMSIFINNLAYSQVDPEFELLSKLGILGGSIVSAIIGFLFLRFCLARER